MNRHWFASMVLISVCCAPALHATSVVSAKPSLIEKAISQQNQQSNASSNFNFDMMHEQPLTSSPAQSFFAAQHQQFSRLVQSLFSSPTSSPTS